MTSTDRNRYGPTAILLFILLIFAACTSVSQTTEELTVDSDENPVNAAAGVEKQPVDEKALVAEIHQRIKSGQFEAALQKTEQLIQQYPQKPQLHLIKAKILKELGREQQAMDYLTRLIRAHPENAGLIVARGQFLLDNGYIESARADFLSAYQKNYRSADILEILAVIEQQNGNLQKSLELIKEALALDPEDHQLWFNRGQLELRLKRLPTAGKSIEKAIALNDRKFEYHQLYVEILGLLNKDREANQHIRELATRFPDNAWVSIRYATLLFAEDKQQAAKSVLNSALEKHPDNYLLYFQLATIHAAEENWQDSIDMFQKGLEVKPDSTWAKVQLSKVYFRIAQNQKAVDLLQQARSEESKDPFVYETLAKIYNRRNDTFAAEAIILEGLEINRKNRTLILEYASLLEKRGNYREAIQAYKEALAITPQDHVILGRLGNLYRLIDDFEQSERFFQRSIQLKPDASWVRSYYVELLSDMEKWQDALAEVERILKITPDDYWAYAKKAQIENQLGNYHSALQSIRKAIQLRPDARWLKEIEANSLENLGRFREAEEALRTALKDAPDNAYLLMRLAYVQLHVNRAAALKTIETAIDSEDFDISTIELYLLLRNESHEVWGFAAESLEQQVLTLMIHKQFDRARTLISGRALTESPHRPYLVALMGQLQQDQDRIFPGDDPTPEPVTGWHHFYLGMNEMQRDQWQQAKRYLQQAMSANPDNLWIMIKLAYVHQHLQEHEPAITLLQQYLKARSQGTHVWVKLRLALNLDLSQRYREAEAVYHEILAVNPKDNVALNNLAWMYLTAKDESMHRVDEALKLAQQAVDISPTPANLDTLAEAYYQKKQYRKALKSVERALDRDRKGLDDFKKTKKKIMRAIEASEK